MGTQVTSPGSCVVFISTISHPEKPLALSSSQSHTPAVSIHPRSHSELEGRCRGKGHEL